jgi:hypothetical protein
MDDTRCMMNYDQPAGFDMLIQYAEGDRRTFARERALKDSVGVTNPEEIIAILAFFSENSRFENCHPNEGFCKALGFHIH